tara:strand:+ start:30875 stop:31573 length:699 start_codon:yes stop_codon:yes gene_type:complete
MIPKIIHQTWKNENIPYDTFKKEWIESWTKLNPTWEYKLWTDEDIKNFLEDKFPWFVDRFNEYPKNIQRVDAFRYFVLYEYGGLYADMDFECFKNIDGLIEQDYKLMLSREHDHLKNSPSLLYRCVANSLMFSDKKHKFWEHVFEVMMAKDDLSDVLSTTGPMMLTEALESYEEIDDLLMMPSHWFYPYTWKHYKNISGKRKVKRVLKEATKTTHEDWPDSYGVHRWTEVWE